MAPAAPHCSPSGLLALFTKLWLDRTTPAFLLVLDVTYAMSCRVLLDEDVHKCGRCQIEFSTLEAFIQHKLQHNCKRMETSSPEVSQEVCIVTKATNNPKGSFFLSHELRQMRWLSLCSQVTAANGSSSGEVPQNGVASLDVKRNASNGGWQQFSLYCAVFPTLFTKQLHWS